MKVKPGTDTYAVEDVRKIDSGMAYQIRTSGCTRTSAFQPPPKITLDLIEYTNCAAQSDGNGSSTSSSTGASLAIIIPVVVAAVLLVAAVLYLIRKRRVAAAKPDEVPELDTEVPIETAP